MRCSALDLVKGIKETVNHECQGSVDAYLLAVLSNSISVCIHSSRREKVVYWVIFTEPYLWDLTFPLGTHSRFYEISNVFKTCRAQRRPWEGDKVGPTSQLNRFILIPGATVTHDVRDKKIENHPTPPDGFLPKAVAPEVMHRAGAGASPNQLGSPTDDFAQGGLIPKAGSNSLGGTKTCSAADPKVPAMSSPGAVPNTPQISPAMAKKINDDIKYQLMKEVRKFGRSK